MRWTQRVLFLTLAALSFAAAQDDPPGRVGRLNYLSGTVSFQPGGVDDWVPATLNRPLTTGDHLWVEHDSRAELHLGSSVLRLSPTTLFEFLNLDDRSTQIRLSEGTLIVRVRQLDQDQMFEVDTPNLAFSLLRPGEYRIDANPDTQTTTITVRGGEGEVTGGGQAFPVRAEDMARVTGNDTITYEMSHAQSPDYFEEWAMSRDRQEDRSVSARYVSRDMIGYEDLDANGDWRPEPEYGAIWVPRRIPAGWAPYRFGHWAWIEPWGWTWVDDAPWGFAPFHYGRWAFVAGNWGWIPGPRAVRPVYAPALVAWVGGPRLSLSLSVGGGGGGVAWFPLGPREVYVPGYRASPAYVNRVNTTNTNITNINVTNVYNNTNVTNIRYVNRNAPNGMTAVSQQTFVGARPVGRNVVAMQPDAMQNAQVVRTAPMTPNRESVLGRVANANAARPPDAVLNRRVVARATPPPAPVPFVQRQQALAANPGQPLDSSAVSRIRAAQPNQARPFVRQAAQAAPSGGGARPASVNAGASDSAAPFSSPQVDRGQPPQRNVQPQRNIQQPIGGGQQPNAGGQTPLQTVPPQERRMMDRSQPQAAPRQAVPAPVTPPQELPPPPPQAVPNRRPDMSQPVPERPAPGRVDPQIQRQQDRRMQRQEDRPIQHQENRPVQPPADRPIPRQEERQIPRPEQSRPQPPDGGGRRVERVQPPPQEHKDAGKAQEKKSEDKKPERREP